MPSERIQQRIDAMLDQVDEAAAALEWDKVRDLAQRVLSIDPENADAHTFLTMAGSDEPAGQADATLTPIPQPVAPSSFAGGRYEVREFLGEGGKKRVFLAHDSLLDREVAFALIRTEGLDDVGRERITREAQAMGRLSDHPHIVPVLDLGQEDVHGVSQPYIVSQYMAGDSAAHRTRRGHSRERCTLLSHRLPGVRCEGGPPTAAGSRSVIRRLPSSPPRRSTSGSTASALPAPGTLGRCRSS